MLVMIYDIKKGRTIWDFSATNCAVLISKVAETYKASQACTWVCDFYANKICGISFLKFTLLDWRSAPFSICEVCFFIWRNYHHSTHKEHCNELGVLAAGSCGCHCKSCSSLREAAEHKCAQQELRCGDEELTFRNPRSSLLLIREGHISCYFSLDILARWNIILFLFDIVKLHVQKCSYTGGSLVYPRQSSGLLEGVQHATAPRSPPAAPWILRRTAAR
jgi:hypothetical protein